MIFQKHTYDFSGAPLRSPLRALSQAYTIGDRCMMCRPCTLDEEPLREVQQEVLQRSYDRICRITTL